MLVQKDKAILHKAFIFIELSRPSCQAGILSQSFIQIKPLQRNSRDSGTQFK